jgi:hypothetical protein
MVGTGGITGTGGAGSGTGGAGLPQATCDNLAAAYREEMPHAKMCGSVLPADTVAIIPPIIRNQCTIAVPNSLGCNPCRTFVNNATTLKSIQSKWDSGNCDRFIKICPLIACLPANGATCTATATGASSCKDQLPVVTQ